MPGLRKVLKISVWVAVFVVAVVFLQRYGIEPLRGAVEDMGFWAPLGLFLLRGISIILPALPSSVYSLLAGSLLGFKVGYLTIILSDLIFCSTAFFIARRWGRNPVSRLVGAGAMEKIDGFSKNQLEGNFFLMTGLLMTGIFDFQLCNRDQPHQLETFCTGSCHQCAGQRLHLGCRWSRSRQRSRPHTGIGSSGNICIGDANRRT